MENRSFVCFFFLQYTGSSWKDGLLVSTYKIKNFSKKKL